MDKTSGQISCTDCLKRSGCKRVCAEIEKLLPKVRGGGHRKEFPTDNIEAVFDVVRRKERGWRITPKRYDNDCNVDQEE